MSQFSTALSRHNFGPPFITSATILMELGTPLPVIQRHLGHSKLTMTEAYLHVKEKVQRSELEKLDGYFSPRPDSDGQKTVRNELTEETPVAGTT